MIAKLLGIWTYVFFFSLFNLTVFLLYYIFSLVIHKLKIIQLSCPILPLGTIYELDQLDFRNVLLDWATLFSMKLRTFSLYYFFVSEIFCTVAVLLYNNPGLIGGINLLITLFLFLVWIFLIYYFKVKSKKLKLQNEVNLENALFKIAEKNKH